ncbi:hypothetical protein SK128_007910 [Halocaridina rubra]|uniref:Uncharacterized protein n=1 Tax=Halocaridina rubra TaxID=373956 RepID=A0AAN8WNS0_HALRR
MAVIKAIKTTESGKAAGTCGLDNLAYAEERDENHNTNSGNPLVSGNECSSNSWSVQTSDNGINLGRRNSHDPDDGTGAEAEESDSFSGASTLPLTAPLRRHQQYLQLVNEPSPTSPPISPTSPLNFPSIGEMASERSALSLRASSGDVPQSPVSLLTEVQVSVPSTPLTGNLSHTSPVPDSPTSVTFTFPMIPGIMSPEHYLKPSSNKVFADTSFQSQLCETNGEVGEDESCSNQILSDKSYVNMSAGADLKKIAEVAQKDLEKLNGVSLRHKMDCDMMDDLDNNRLSGLSVLSAVSGMTSASTIDLEHASSQSLC